VQAGLRKQELREQERGKQQHQERSSESAHDASFSKPETTCHSRRIVG
jgi:hypothetical protein